MKKQFFFVGLIVVLSLSLYNYFQIQEIKEWFTQVETESLDSPSIVEEEDIELGDVMTKLQRHSNKLWFSGKANNWPLAAFYVHELEETFEELTNHQVYDEGVDITMLAGRKGLLPLKAVEEAVNQQDPDLFFKSYNNLIVNCNNCHQSSNHSFVVIKTPTTPALDNQEYEIE